ncbi:MAG: thiolase family protein [Solirubrobacteraceae bacterium]
MSDLSGRYCIAGIGEAPSGKRPDLDHWELNLIAAKRAIEDAGIDKSEIDCVISSDSMVVNRRRHHVVLCEQLGIPLARYTELSAMGGSAPTSNLRHALAALHAGMATVALVVGADNLRTGRGRQGAIYAGPAEYHNAEFEVPYGPYMATLYALFAQRWMHEYGWTSEQLAAVPVAARRHAALHPGAYVREPRITREDVLESRPVCSPFRLLDCSLFTDGGAAYVVMTAERAEVGPKPPVYVLGVGGAYSYYYFEKWPDLIETPREIMASAARESFAMAGLSPGDMDVAGIADMFSFTVPVALESAGFCDRGEGADFVQDGRIELGGDLPVNTHGGNLSYGLPGMGAQFIHLTEVCAQLRGEAGERQVDGARLGYVHNWSGNMSQHGSAVLGSQRP